MSTKTQNQPPKGATEVITKDDVGQVPAEVASGALVPLETAPMNEAAALFVQEAQGELNKPPRIPLVTINHQEAKFVLPSGEMVDVVSGYPVNYFHTRKFYKAPPRAGEQGKPPDCWSPDGVRPSPESSEQQSDLCANCTQNQFETGRDGRSKACATLTWVFLVNGQFGDPPVAVLVAPSSSLRALVGTRFEQGYFARAMSKHGRFEIVSTHFHLKQEGDMVVFCRLDPKMGAPVTDREKARKLAQIRNAFLDAMQEIRGQTVTVDAEPPQE